MLHALPGCGPAPCAGPHGQDRLSAPDQTECDRPPSHPPSAIKTTTAVAQRTEAAVHSVRQPRWVAARNMLRFQCSVQDARAPGMQTNRVSQPLHLTLFAVG